MRKFIFFNAMSALLILFKGYAGDNYTFGDRKYGKVTVDTIQANGKVVLEGTKVSDQVVVNGSLIADGSCINSLQVNGQVYLNNCLVKKTSRISGSLNADNTEFQKELSVSSQKLTLKNCSVDSLIVREVNGYSGVQIIELCGVTKVTGPIFVNSGNGEIWLSSDSEDLEHDQIKGAKVIRK